MKVEYSDNRQVKPRKKRRKKSKAKRIFTALTVIVVVLAVTVALMLTVLFNVAEIKVLGSSIYSADEIIYSSGILTGDNLLRLPTDEIKQRITEALPYVKTVEIIKSFPDSVGIKVTPAEEKMLITVGTSSYVADGDYKLLRLCADGGDGMMRIIGINAENPTLGKTLEFSDKQQRDVLNTCLAMCSEKGFSVQYVDMESLVDINIVVDGRLFVKLGSSNDLAGKLNHLSAMLPSIDGENTASVSLEGWTVTDKQAILKYCDINELIKQ